MIVPSMTHAEVYSELERDRDSLTAWWEHQTARLRRRALKARKFPLCIWLEYKSPRLVEYIILVRIMEKRLRLVIAGFVALRRERDGWSAYTTWANEHRLIAPMVILPHAFKRYAERVGVEETGVDLIRHYFVRNSFSRDTHEQHVVSRSVRYNGEEHLCSCVEEGVLMGQKHGDIFVAKTFITYGMSGARQQEEFDARRRDIPTAEEYYKRHLTHSYL